MLKLGVIVEIAMIAKFEEIRKHYLARKSRLDETLSRVEYGKEKFVVTHQGKPIAKLVPLSGRERIRNPRSA